MHPIQQPSYRLVRHGTYFYEMILGDLRRVTLDAFAADVARLYESETKHAHWMRALYDLSAATAPTPYSLHIFSSLGKGRPIPTSNIRLAFLVPQTFFFTLVQLQLNRTSPRQLNGGLVRAFTRRDEAFQWLNEGIPATEMPKQTETLPESR